MKVERATRSQAPPDALEAVRSQARQTAQPSPGESQIVRAERERLPVQE